MTRKKIYIILLAVITLAVSAAVWFASYAAGSATAAKGDIEYETSLLKEQTKAVKSDIDDLKRELEGVNAELDAGSTVNNDYMENKKSRDELAQEVNELQNSIAELDSKIEAARAKLGTQAADGVKTGRSYALTAEEPYICPESIPPGRYTAKGNGTITITNADGKTRVSQNLSAAYDHSYTFNLSDKEKVQVTDNVTLTELK